MAQNPGTKIEKFIVEKQNGEKLVGLLFEAGSQDIRVLCHGFRSNKDSKTIVTIGDALAKENYSVVRFDFSGNGESEGEFQYSNYWGEVEDLRAIILYFKERGRRISAIIGHSKGANVVLLYASKYHDVPRVVNVSARFNLDKGIEERFGTDFLKILNRDGYIDVMKKKKKNGKKKGKDEVEYRVTQKDVKDRQEINMAEACSRIDKECRVLTVHGSADEITPVEDAFQFDIIPNHTKQIIKGANHCYTLHKDELVSAILSFTKHAWLAAADTRHQGFQEDDTFGE